MSSPRSHIVIPDTQVKPGVPVHHLEWAGQYIADRSPDVLVVLGDWWDMPSLSSYDKGTRAAEGRRIFDDLDAGNEAMDRFLRPIKARKAAWKKMRKVFLIGNHEQRIERATNITAELHKLVSYDDLNTKDFEVHDFLEPVEIDGVTYSHFFPRAASGAITQNRRGAPSARAQCIRQGGSATAGHQQGLDCSPVVLGHRLQWGLIAGSFYLHDESYLTPQGHNYWKGIVVKHDVRNGGYSPMFVDLPYLERRFGSPRDKRQKR
jgi:hypothetical protein